MDEACVVFSRKGLFKGTMRAQDIKSREHYRNLWPLVTPEKPHRLLTYVRPSFDGDELVRRSHFRLYTGKQGLNAKELFETEERERQRSIGESPAHRKAKELIAAELQRRLDNKLGLPWSYRDESISEYSLSGNLLLGAEEITTEQVIRTPFGKQYRLDVAIKRRKILNQELVLGGIEIELGHAFDGRKALAGRTMGFPLISVDITDMTIDELTPEWASRALTDTTRSHQAGRRKTYIYLNPLLYPLYVQLPKDLLDLEPKHQFVVFANDENLDKVKQILSQARSRIGMTHKDVLISDLNYKSKQSYSQLENLGRIAGEGWMECNDHRCLTITMKRVASPFDMDGHLVHICIAALLAGWGDCLVGYKYRLGVYNDDPEEDVWREYVKGWRRVLPKRLSVPISLYVKTLESL